MNNPPPPSLLAASANLLPKLAALLFLVFWSVSSNEPSLERLCLVFGSLALFEAFAVAALKKQDPLLEWGDLPLVLRSLFGPTALPLYALLAVGVFFLSGESSTVRKLPATSAGSVPARFSPANRSIPTPPGPGNYPSPPSGVRPGTPGVPSTANSSRPPFGNPRPAPGFPTGPSRVQPPPSAPGATPKPGPPTAPTSSAAPAPTTPATTTPAASPPKP